VLGNEHDLYQPDCSIYGGATSWRWWRTALTQTISLFDEYPWTKTGLRVRDGEADWRSGASTACISLITTSAVTRRPRGGDEQT
jgi:hypothetical protein